MGRRPAASLVPALAAQKVRAVITTARDMGRACGAFVDDVTVERLSHAGQTQLDAAVAGARRRPVGDAGAWGWDRRGGTVFLAPLWRSRWRGTVRRPWGGPGATGPCSYEAVC
jgi:hypothetical protein